VRILLINYEFTITGASTLLLRLALHLKSRGHALRLLSVIQDDGPIRARYLEHGIPIVDSANSKEFDLAIANSIAVVTYVIDVGRHLPTIWYVHESDVALTVLSRNLQWASAFAIAAAVVYDMPFQRDFFRPFTHHLPPEKFDVVPGGVDIDMVALARQPRPPKTRPFRLMHVGTLEPRKRPEDIIHAVAAAGLDIECVFCGRLESLEPEARAIVEREPDKYRLLGVLPDDEKLAWLASADVFCLASDSETQALVVYEAALLGKPLLLTDLPCYRDVFRHGHNCLMVPRRSREMLGLSLRMLLASPELRARLGEAARRTALRFSNEVYFARFDAVIASVANAAQAG
jgi:glycosyltransferase involved in cell wall biosynthesis